MGGMKLILSHIRAELDAIEESLKKVRKILDVSE